MSGLDDLARVRRLHGATAALWGGEKAESTGVGWTALTGAQHVDFNVVLLDRSSGGSAVPEALAEIKEARAPAILMVTAGALSDVHRLVEASWVCIGAMPLMGLDLDAAPAPDVGAAVRRLEREEVPQAQRLIEAVFGYEPELARVALPESTAEAGGRSVWGLFAPDGTLLSSAGTMVVEDLVAVWSMATAPDHRRRGHASRLLRGALAILREEGVSYCALTASASGEPFYRALGFVELEWWQQWSRPRWVFARL